MKKKPIYKCREYFQKLLDEGWKIKSINDYDIDLISPDGKTGKHIYLTNVNIKEAI